MVAQKVVQEGMIYRVAAKIFGISTGAVSAWTKKYKKGNLIQSAKDKEQSPDYKIYQLEDHIKELKTEIEIYFRKYQTINEVINNVAKSIEEVF